MGIKLLWTAMALFVAAVLAFIGVILMWLDT